jgi:CO/xanthine dehydrogenase Mo-binding subunit
MDPLDLRLKNAIRPEDTTPTQTLLNRSNVGDLPQCLKRLRALIGWDEWRKMEVGKHKIRAKGISCLWKNSTIDTDASSGAILAFNRNGSINLITGVVEIGTGSKTVLAQILAERMNMDVNDFHVAFEVNTQTSPEHWKTVASRATLMAGRAVLEAAEDAIRQLLSVASCVLRVSPDDLELGRGKVYVRGNPDIHVDIKAICYGYVFPDGTAIGGQVIGRGTGCSNNSTCRENSPCTIPAAPKSLPWGESIRCGPMP